MTPELEALVIDVFDKVAFAIQAWGFQRDNSGGYNYIHAQRNLQEKYMSKSTNSPLEYLSNLDLSLDRNASSHQYLDKRYQYLTYGSLPHGKQVKMVPGTERTFFREAIPQEQLSMGQRMWSKLTGYVYEQQYYCDEPIEKKIESTVPSLAEVTTLSEQPEDLCYMAYTFPHGGDDDSGRHSNPIDSYLVCNTRTFQKLIAFCTSNPHQVYDLFKQLSGEFPRKEKIFNSRGGTSLIGISLQKIRDQLKAQKVDHHGSVKFEDKVDFRADF